MTADLESFFLSSPFNRWLDCEIVCMGAEEVT